MLPLKFKTQFIWVRVEILKNKKLVILLPISAFLETCFEAFLVSWLNICDHLRLFIL